MDTDNSTTLTREELNRLMELLELAAQTEGLTPEDRQLDIKLMRMRDYGYSSLTPEAQHEMNVLKWQRMSETPDHTLLSTRHLQSFTPPEYCTGGLPADSGQYAPEDVDADADAFLDVIDPSVVCPVCTGQGTVYYKADGTLYDWATINALPEEVLDGMISQDCPNCSGTGKLPDPGEDVVTCLRGVRFDEIGENGDATKCYNIDWYERDGEEPATDDRYIDGTQVDELNDTLIWGLFAEFGHTRTDRTYYEFEQVKDKGEEAGHE